MDYRRIVRVLVFLLFGNIAFAQSSRFYHATENLPEINCDTSGSWVLVFSDEFNEEQLDTEKWRIMEFGYCKNHDRGEIRGRVPKTVEVSNGTLKLKLIRDSVYGSSNYDLPEDTVLGDGLKNRRLFSFACGEIMNNQEILQYGKYEIRCRITNPAEGIWPSYWTHSGLSSPTPVMERRWSELDFFEIYYRNNKFIYTNNIHFDWNGDGGTRNEQLSFERKNYNYFSEWHTFTSYINDHEASFYIDGKLVERKYRFQRKFIGGPVRCDKINSAKNLNEANAWARHPMFLFVSMALERNRFPQDEESVNAIYEIDYVRYWEKVKK